MSDSEFLSGRVAVASVSNEDKSPISHLIAYRVQSDHWQPWSSPIPEKAEPGSQGSACTLLRGRQLPPAGLADDQTLPSIVECPEDRGRSTSHKVALFGKEEWWAASWSRWVGEAGRCLALQEWE